MEILDSGINQNGLAPQRWYSDSNRKTVDLLKVGNSPGCYQLKQRTGMF